MKDNRENLVNIEEAAAAEEIEAPEAVIEVVTTEVMLKKVEKPQNIEEDVAEATEVVVEAIEVVMTEIKLEKQARPVNIEVAEEALTVETEVETEVAEVAIKVEEVAIKVVTIKVLTKLKVDKLKVMNNKKKVKKVATEVAEAPTAEAEVETEVAIEAEVAKVENRDTDLKLKELKVATKLKEKLLLMWIINLEKLMERNSNTTMVTEVMTDLSMESPESNIIPMIDTVVPEEVEMMSEKKDMEEAATSPCTKRRVRLILKIYPLMKLED